MEKFRELSIEEMQKVDGGGWGVIAGGILLFMAYDIMMNPKDTIDKFKAGFERGYNDLSK
jgi:bacteriocin-like protein